MQIVKACGKWMQIPGKTGRVIYGVCFCYSYLIQRGTQSYYKAIGGII